MPSSLLGSTDGRTTTCVAFHHPLWTSSHSRTALGVACHHCPLTENAAERRRAWHAIIALGQHTRSNEVGRGMPSSPLGSTNGRTTSTVACHHRLWTISHSQTASGVACHHRLLTENGVERRWAWHSIIAFGQHTWSNDVGRSMPSSPLGSTHGRATSGVAGHHRLWASQTIE